MADIDQSRNYVDDADDEVISRFSETELIGTQSPTNAQNDVQQDSERRPTVYTTQAAALFIIVNVTVGVGLLALPFEMQMAGLYVSIVISVLFVLLVTATCIMCTELTVKSDVQSYHEIVKVHCHPIVYKITQISILMIVFGTTVAYMAVIGDQSDRLFRTISKSPQFCNNWYMNRRFIMVMSTLLFIKPLCAIKTIDFLKYASFLGLSSIGFIAYVLISNFSELDHIPKDVNFKYQSLSSSAAILPALCLCYQCHLSLVPTVATIRKSEKHKAFITVTVAMIICTIMYISISVLAVLTFGKNIKEDFIENFPGREWSTLTTIAMVGIKCILTLPAAFLPIRLSLVDILDNSIESFAILKEGTKRIAVTIVTLNLALLLALLVPNIAVAINLLGFLAVMFVFSLPGLAYLNLVKQNRLEKQQLAGFGTDVLLYSVKDQLKRLISLFMIILGFLMAAAVLYKSISEMNVNSEPLCTP